MRVRPAGSEEAIEHAARHCLSDLPYRMIVFKRTDGNETPLYLVAGSEEKERGAERALRLAYETHGGLCFYCQHSPGEDLTIDHVEPLGRGGTDSLQNLVVACRSCNQQKGQRPIDAFRPEAGRAWLKALLIQIEDRLARLNQL